jgi:hypothetical protein
MPLAGRETTGFCPGRHKQDKNTLSRNTRKQLMRRGLHLSFRLTLPAHQVQC